MSMLEPWRPASSVERRLFDRLLAGDDPRLVALRIQVALMNVAVNCVCGCGSLSVDVPASAPRAERWGPEIAVWNRDDAIEALLRVSDGTIEWLEITHHAAATVPLAALDLDRFDPPEVV